MAGAGSALLAEEAGPMEVDDLGSPSGQEAAGGERRAPRDALAALAPPPRRLVLLLGIQSR